VNSESIILWRMRPCAFECGKVANNDYAKLEGCRYVIPPSRPRGACSEHLLNICCDLHAELLACCVSGCRVGTVLLCALVRPIVQELSSTEGVLHTGDVAAPWKAALR